MKKNKKIITLVIIAIVLVVIVGITYALFTYSKAGSNQQLVAGDIYMKYAKGDTVNLKEAKPSVTYNPDEYFEFSIEGKNNYKKDIVFEIMLDEGATPDPSTGRTERIKPELLKFRLVEIKGDQEEELIKEGSYNSITKKRIWVDRVKANTKEEIKYTYRLYMWISIDAKIGNITTADYDIDTWNNKVFASVKVLVNGDFEDKELPIQYPPSASKVLSKTSEDNYLYDDHDILYFSGTNEDINFNYVWYSGKLWRITQINPDGTMKMITEDAITGIYFGETVDFENSWAYDWLNEDFLDTLYNYQDIIVTDAKWELESVYDGSHPTPYKTVTTEVGLLNPYEFHQSIDKVNTDNRVEKYQKTYLNNGYNWWLSSACQNTLETTCMRSVHWDGNNGDLWGGSPNAIAIGVRPAVVLKSDIRLEHSGTKEDPFTIKADKRKGYEDEKLNERLSGEYVKVDNKVYRIVGIENGTTKLTSVDYVRDNNGSILNKQYGDSSLMHSYNDIVNLENENYWGAYLNSTWITPNLKKYLVSGTYYLGLTMIMDSSGAKASSYKGTICQDVNTKDSIKKCEKTNRNWTGLVGLPRIGEMFAFPFDEDSKNTPNIYFITPYEGGGLYTIGAYLTGNDNKISHSDYNSLYAVRPSINLNSNVKIASGEGTKQSPYEIKCDSCS